MFLRHRSRFHTLCFPQLPAEHMLIHSVATASYTCQSTSRHEPISTQHSNDHASHRPRRACRHGATAIGMDQKHCARTAHHRHLSLSHLQPARPFHPELAGIGQVSDIGLGAGGDPGRSAVLRLVPSAVRSLRALYVLAPAYVSHALTGPCPLCNDGISIELQREGVPTFWKYCPRCGGALEISRQQTYSTTCDWVAKMQQSGITPPCCDTRMKRRGRLSAPPCPVHRGRGRRRRCPWRSGCRHGRR